MESKEQKKREKRLEAKDARDCIEQIKKMRTVLKDGKFGPWITERCSTKKSKGSEFCHVHRPRS